METTTQSEKDQELWHIAKKRVRFKRHLATYLVLNTMFWCLWYFTDRDEESSRFPWPIWPMFGWGIGLVLSYLNAYVFTQHSAIEREYQRLKNKS